MEARIRDQKRRVYRSVYWTSFEHYVDQVTPVVECEKAHVRELRSHNSKRTLIHAQFP
jgi:hypothetical protein